MAAYGLHSVLSCLVLVGSPQVDQWQTDTGLPGRGKARTREGALWCSGQPTLEGGKRFGCNRRVTESISLRDNSQYDALPVGRMLVLARFAHQGQRIRLTSPGLGALNVHCVFRDLELAVYNLIKKAESLVSPPVIVLWWSPVSLLN